MIRESWNRRPVMVFALAGARTEESMSNGESSRERGQHNPAPASKTVFDERRLTARSGRATVPPNVAATDRVDLRATGSVDGNIVAPRFAMAEGAVIKGKVDANRKSTT